MIGKLLRSGAGLVIWFCVGTVIALIIMVTYVWLSWNPQREQVVQATALLRGTDLFALYEEAQGEKDLVSAEQVSFDQILQKRAEKWRTLELQTQAMRNDLKQLRFERIQLAEKRQQLAKTKRDFDATLTARVENASAQGEAELRSILEGLKSKQAKDLLLQMIRDGEIDKVVVQLASMTNTKRTRIIGEFKTSEEAEEIGKVLRLIRDGSPDTQMAEAAREELERPGPGPVPPAPRP